MIYGSLFLTACSNEHDPALNEPSIIEESEGGLALIEREFGECDPNDIPSPDTPRFSQYQQPINSYSVQNQRQVLDYFPHQYPSLGQMYPLRGSWRQSKSEIMDIVDRRIYDPSTNSDQPLLKFFDMVVLINVADRRNGDPQNSSAQRMQILVRNESNGSNTLSDWDLIETWPISSGVPCGEKIATPTGVFKLDPRQDRFTPEYSSRQFDNVNMYETMFLFHSYQNGNNTGVAIHGTYKTSVLGRRDSGGCIRLYRENSKCLYETFAGLRSTSCLSGGKLDYRGQVPSFLSKNGEADPEYLSNGSLTVSGIKVLVAIYDDMNDRLN